MSALPPKAGIPDGNQHVRWNGGYKPIARIQAGRTNSKRFRILGELTPGATSIRRGICWCTTAAAALMNFTTAAGFKMATTFLDCNCFLLHFGVHAAKFFPRKRALRLAQGVAVMTRTTKILIGVLLCRCLWRARFSLQAHRQPARLSANRKGCLARAKLVGEEP